MAVKRTSVDSIVSFEGRIIMKQFKRMVVMIMRENNGWTKMWIATRRTGLNGDKNQSASVPENLKKSIGTTIYSGGYGNSGYGNLRVGTQN